jgi:thioredoxin reductase (NADPH)
MINRQTPSLLAISNVSAVTDNESRHAEHHPLVILGGGPAGLTAALYAARANLAPLVLQGPEPGGQLLTTTDVENYPGFTDGILGPELMARFAAQAERFGAELRYGSVTAVDFAPWPFRLQIDHNDTAVVDAVIIATGASAKYLGLANERRWLGHGVSACATCDGAFFKGQEIAVVGGGDAAMEEALFLTRFATRVYVIHRRGTLRASKIMQERALAHPLLTFVWNTVVEEVLGETTVEGIGLRHVETGESSILPVQGLFVAIGHQPNTDVFKGWVEMDDLGYIRTRPGSTYTSVNGIFAAGDVQDHVYRQAVTAAASGAMAAIDAERWLAHHATSAVQQTASLVRNGYRFSAAVPLQCLVLLAG